MQFTNTSPFSIKQNKHFRTYINAFTTPYYTFKNSTVIIDKPTNKTVVDIISVYTANKIPDNDQNVFGKL